MRKEFDKIYHLADLTGHGTRVGEMECFVCSKGIDSNTQDWVESKKSVDKGNDWTYRARHRDCIEQDSGWVSIEKEEIDYRNKVDDLVTYLNQFKKPDGSFNNVFYGALAELGIEVQ